MISVYELRNRKNERVAEIDEIKLVAILQIIKYRNKNLYTYLKTKVYDKIEPDNKLK